MAQLAARKIATPWNVAILRTRVRIAVGAFLFAIQYNISGTSSMRFLSTTESWITHDYSETTNEPEA